LIQKKINLAKKKFLAINFSSFQKKKFDAGILSLIERKLSFSAFSVALQNASPQVLLAHFA